MEDIEHLRRKFHIITVISNPVRYESRYRLFREFKQRLISANVNFWVTELAFGERPFEVTHFNSFVEQEFQFRTFDELWHKENLINATISRLPLDWEYVAWVDADTAFLNPDWVDETLHQLQHYMVVQMFGDAIDLGPTGEPIQAHRGFVKAYIENGCQAPNEQHPRPMAKVAQYAGSFAHTGFAWAARREAIETLGGLIDFAILGSADHNMAQALIGNIERTFPTQMHSRYAFKMLQWQERALQLHKDIGFVEGTLAHYWHGRKKDRGYVDRWKILTENNYDPDLDLMRDSQGLIRLTDRNIPLRDGIRAYLRSRNEDSIEA